MKITVNSPFMVWFKRWRVQEASDSYIMSCLFEGADRPSLELTIKVPGHFTAPEHTTSGLRRRAWRAGFVIYWWRFMRMCQRENIPEMVNLVAVPKRFRRVLGAPSSTQNEEEWIKSVIEAMFDHPFWPWRGLLHMYIYIHILGTSYFW